MPPVPLKVTIISCKNVIRCLTLESIFIILNHIKRPCKTHWIQALIGIWVWWSRIFRKQTDSGASSPIAKKCGGCTGPQWVHRMTTLLPLFLSQPLRVHRLNSNQRKKCLSHDVLAQGMRLKTSSWLSLGFPMWPRARHPSVSWLPLTVQTPWRRWHINVAMSEKLFEIAGHYKHVNCDDCYQWVTKQYFLQHLSFLSENVFAV